VHHHLQLTLPCIERDEARARIAAKIAARQVSVQRSARRTQVTLLRRGAFTKRDLELTIERSLEFSVVSRKGLFQHNPPEADIM
jgi:hypothetical protein